MFSPPPLDWIEECLKEWAEKQREKEQSSSTGKRGKSNAEENTSSDDHETKYDNHDNHDTESVLTRDTRDRVCFYDDGEAPPREHIQPKTPLESGTHVAFF